MDTGALLLLGLAVVLAVGIVGASQYVRGSSASAELAARSAIHDDPTEPLRIRADLALRRTQWGRLTTDRLAMSGVDILAIDFAAGLVAIVVAMTLVVDLVVPLWVAIAVALLSTRAAYAWLQRAQEQRREAFIYQLPELARVLSNASSAGLSLATSLAMASRELEEPAAAELVKVREELRIGASIEDALDSLEQRMPSREIGVLVTTLAIQQRSGGDIVAMLRDLARTLEARRELRREIKTMMTGEVFSAYLVVGLGVVSLLLINASDPGLLDEMFSQLWGILAIAVAAGMFTIGFVLIRRFTRIDV